MVENSNLEKNALEKSILKKLLENFKDDQKKTFGEIFFTSLNEMLNRVQDKDVVDFEMVDDLLELGADEKEAMYNAIRNENVEQVQHILKRGYNVTGYELKLAINMENYAIVEFLCKDLTSKNLNEMTLPNILYEAITTVNFDIVHLLIQKGFDIKNNGSNAIMYAIEFESPEILKLLIENNAPFSNLEGILNRATFCHSIEIIKILMEEGIDIKYCGWGALIEKIKLDDIDSVKFLIEHGVRVTSRGSYAFEAAYKYKRKEILELLLQKAKEEVSLFKFYKLKRMYKM